MKSRMIDRPKAPLGSGKRFKSLVAALSDKSDVHDEPAMAAHIGRKKFGSSRFQKMAAKGK